VVIFDGLTPSAASPVSLDLDRNFWTARFVASVIEARLEFLLVPWQPALEQHIGRYVSGVMIPGGGVEWSFGREREWVHWLLCNISIPSPRRATTRSWEHRH